MQYGHFIGGRWLDSAETIPVLHKFTGEEYARIGKGTREIVNQAVTCARETFDSQRLSELERYEILMNAVDIFRRRRDELADILICEAGKVVKDAYAEIDRGIQTFLASAEEAKRIGGEVVPLGLGRGDNRMAFTIRVPVGVVGAITPFNFPFNLTAHKVGPALAAGNAVVLKPAAATPIIACVMTDILTEAGLPAGFLNVVNGSGRETGEYLLEDERINMYTFTGSPEVGRRIKSRTGIRKVTLELGNNSPNIVHLDAPDLDRAAELCVTRGFSNAGQACISVQRVYVHRSIYDTFVEKAANHARMIRYGNPHDPQTDVGPMISESEAIRAEAWIKEAVQAGAQALVGGGRSGALLEPTLLVNVNEDMKVVCQEVFAPVISILPYDDIQEAFKKANASNLGLQVGLFTSNLPLAMLAAQMLEFGGVIVNDVSTYRADVMPYGGVKDSGIGKEGPHFSIREMTDERLIVLNLN
jgi:acyl-CoA reductase-like NAD-dependent aldehyde dehydrogenase